MRIRREIGRLEGVESVEGDETTKTVTVKWHNPATWEKISATLNEAGYQADQGS